MCLNPINQLRDRPSHVHYFRGSTGETLQHTHFIEFFTYPVNGNGYDGHIHQFQGITELSLQGKVRHLHRFLTQTGPAISLPDGSHYHELHTEVDDEPFEHYGNYYRTVFAIQRHKHIIYGATGTPIGSVPPNW